MKSMNVRSQAGFTLLEILLVVVIIGMLVGIAAVKFGPQMGQSRITAARAQIHTYKQALDIYELNNSFFPATEQGLMALFVAPTTPPVPGNWRGPYADGERPRKDPWGHEYVYRNPGQKNPAGYDLYSWGPDGIEGNEDDIGNWQ
jgi:general secretion pathway protein G